MGTLTDIRAYIPAFERRGFSLTQSGDERTCLNERLDTIVRLPFREDTSFIPVGVVSKDYVLVQHTDVLDVGTVITSGLKESETEKKNFENWRKAGITLSRLAPWVDKDLREGWGFKAAARTFHIARCGSDAEVKGKYKGNTPTTIAMQKTKLIPGAPKECRNLFDLSQILAWLVKERRDVQEQLEWRESIHGLMTPLMN